MHHYSMYTYSMSNIIDVEFAVFFGLVCLLLAVFIIGLICAMFAKEEK